MADEIMETRMNITKVKAVQIIATGAKIVVAPCAICKANLPLVAEYWQTGAVVKGLMDLVGNAILL